MMSWSGALWTKLPGFPELLNSEYGIKVYGQGHVVTHNYIANFHDAIDVSTYGEPDGTPDIASTKLSGPTEMDDRTASSIDFYRQRHLQYGRQLHRDATAARTISASSKTAASIRRRPRSAPSPSSAARSISTATWSTTRPAAGR